MSTDRVPRCINEWLRIDLLQETGLPARKREKIKARALNGGRCMFRRLYERDTRAKIWGQTDVSIYPTLSMGEIKEIKRNPNIYIEREVWERSISLGLAVMAKGSSWIVHSFNFHSYRQSFFSTGVESGRAFIIRSMSLFFFSLSSTWLYSCLAIVI